MASTPLGDLQTTTFVAGMRHHRLTAPMVADGPLDRDPFLAWVEQFLCPTVQPGDIAILDNLSSHKVDGVKEGIAGVGATAPYLPPYSPDLNPIEKLLSKLKTLLRQRIRELLRLFGICKYLN